MWLRLKRDLALVQSENIEMINPRVKVRTITFDYDLAVEEDILRPPNVFKDLGLESARANRNRELAVELGWATQSTLDLGNSSSDTRSPGLDDCSALPMAPIGDLRRKITLDEQVPNFGRFAGKLTDDDFIGEDIGLYFDQDGNLINQMPDVGFRGLEDTSVVPQVHQNQEQVEVNNDALGDMVNDGSPMEIENETYQGQYEQIDDVPIENHGRDDVEHQGEGGVTHDKQRTKGTTQRKKVKLIIDERIMLSREEMVEHRDSYKLNQTLLIRERELKQTIMDTKLHMESLLSRPLSVSNCALDLTAFWCSAGSRNIGARPHAPQGAATTLDHSIAQYDTQPLDMYQPDEFEVDPPEPEVRRRHSSPVDGHTAIDVGGIGVESNERLGLMPWSIEYPAPGTDSYSEHSSGGFDNLRRDFETIFDPALGRPVKRQRKHSRTSGSPIDLQGLEDESLAIHRHHLTPTGSRSGSQSRYGSHQEPHVGSFQGSRATSRQRGDGGGPESSMDAHDLFMTEPGAGELTATQELVAVDRETINFLDYVRSILREAKATSFSFSDVISAHRRRDVAAAAFYHILALSTMDKMKPTQHAPFQDIHIELIE